jgi:hypothetical protein
MANKRGYLMINEMGMRDTVRNGDDLCVYLCHGVSLRGV